MRRMRNLAEAIEQITATPRKIEAVLAPFRRLEELADPFKGLDIGGPSPRSSIRKTHSAVDTQQVRELERRVEKLEVDLTRSNLDVQGLLESERQGFYVMVSPDRDYVNAGHGSDLDARIKTHESKSGGGWILMCKTRGVSKTEEQRIHKNLRAAGHPRYGNKLEEYKLTPQLLADLRKARVLTDDVKDSDFFQGTLF